MDKVCSIKERDKSFELSKEVKYWEFLKKIYQPSISELEKYFKFLKKQKMYNFSRKKHLKIRVFAKGWK